MAVSVMGVTERRFKG